MFKKKAITSFLLPAQFATFYQPLVEAFALKTSAEKLSAKQQNEVKNLFVNM